MSEWPLNTIDKTLIALALQEDLNEPPCDVTTQCLLHEVAFKELNHQAIILSKMDHPLVMCGLAVIKEVLHAFEDRCQIVQCVADGDRIAPRDVILQLHGDPGILLMIERVLLNFLQHLIAIASFTARFVESVADTSLKILDTRKTTPGWRHLEKYAVHCGGGVNHRMGLYDAVMIKDTHIDLLGGLASALAKLPTLTTQSVPVIVEVRDQNELDLVLHHGRNKVSRVLLDNMNERELRQAVQACQGILPTEASGNITLDTIAAVAATGVDFASVGALTHSAPHVDLSMKEPTHD